MRIIYVAVLAILTGCDKKYMYTDNLADPSGVLSDYIRSVLHGDTNRTLYYTSGSWEEVKKLGPLGNVLEGGSQQKARRRWFEHYSWGITELKKSDKEIIYKVTLKYPNPAYVMKRISVLMGMQDESGNITMKIVMPEDEAREIIRKDVNLPIISENFNVVMIKNKYGWVYNNLNEGNEKLTSFLNNQ